MQLQPYRVGCVDVVLWESGTVTHIAAGRKGSDYTIYFKSDKRYIVTKLPAANYGPGSVGEATRKS